MFKPLIRTCTLLIAGALFICSVPLARADNPRHFTWPGVQTTVTVMNGWVVVQGVSNDQNNNLLWQTPLAPAGGGVSFRHGWGTLFVEVGRRQFVVDEGNGNTRELRPGQVVRQDLPWSPPALPPRTYGNNSTGETDTPAVPLSDDAKAVLDMLNKANRELIDSLANLELVIKAYETNQAKYADVAAARERVRVARANQDLAERGLLRNVPPDLAALPTTQPDTAPVAIPVPPPQDPKVAVMQKKLLDVTGQYVAAQTDVARLRQAGADSNAMAVAQKKMTDLGDQMDQMDAQLRQMRLVEDVDPCPIKISMTDLSRVAQIERNLLELNQQYRQADDRMQKAQAAYNNKTGSLDDVQAAQNNVVALMKKINAGRRDLEDMRRTTCQAARDALDNTPTDSQPAPKG